MLTANRLCKVLSYAPATGIFRWKVSASTRAPVGTIAGAKNGRGYRQIRINGRPYSASRLAWLYMTGKWPSSEISYVNGKPSDTRWANLREATSYKSQPSGSNIVAKSQSAKAKIAKAFAARAVRNHVRFRSESRPSASASCMSALVISGHFAE
jgi:hypothetical protein